MQETCKTTAQKVIKAVGLALGIIVFGLMALFCTPLGVAVRGAVASVESHPYIYVAREGGGKKLPPHKTITLFSHNGCWIPGYSITDGQVTPPSDRKRMEAEIHNIQQFQPDVISLQEVAAICDADFLSSQLPTYPYIIPVAGVRAIGPSSMMYIASRYEIVRDSVQFTPFVKGTEVTGRAQYSEKGVLSFDLRSAGASEPFATIVCTHLQHSEIPANPEGYERKARAAQMKKIATLIQEKMQQRPVIFAGDLNQEEGELEAFLHAHHITWLRRDPAVRGMATWGGDAWCAQLMGKEASGPLVLDYLFVAGNASATTTVIKDPHYCDKKFVPEAVSDHNILFSTVTLG